MFSFKNMSANERRILLVIALNIVIVAVESVAGVISGSLALISDAWHNLSDVMALVVTAVAISFSAREANESMSYGFVRSEMMASFINSVFLTILMIWVGVEAIDRLLHPVAVNGAVTMVTAFAALVVNTASAFVLGGHSHHGHSHEHAEEGHTDLNVTSAFWHMASDAALSFAVVLGGAAMMIWGISWLDSLLSLVFVAVVLRASYGILKTSFLSLMDKSDPKKLTKLKSLILENPNVKELHDIHLSYPSSNERYFSAHIVLDENMSLKEVEGVIEDLRHKLGHEGVTHLMLQPETSKYASNGGGSFCDPHTGCGHSH